MVFKSLALFIRSKGPDEFWRKRRIFKMSAHYTSRSRNCYSLAIRNVLRALQYTTRGRQVKKDDMKALWETRITAGSEQHGLPYEHLREGLSRSGIALNRKSLSELAIWEPFSFKALTQVAWTTMRRDPKMEKIDVEPPNNVITKEVSDK